MFPFVNEREGSKESGKKELNAWEESGKLTARVSENESIFSL